MKKFSSYIRFTQSSRELFQMINDQAFDYNYFYFRDVFETEVLSFGRDDRLQIYSFLLWVINNGSSQFLLLSNKVMGLLLLYLINWIYLLKKRRF